MRNCPKCGHRMNAHFCGGCGFREDQPQANAGTVAVIEIRGAISSDGLLDVDGNALRSKLLEHRGKKVSMFIKIL